MTKVTACSARSRPSTPSRTATSNSCRLSRDTCPVPAVNDPSGTAGTISSSFPRRWHLGRKCLPLNDELHRCAPGHPAAGSSDPQAESPSRFAVELFVIVIGLIRLPPFGRRVHTILFPVNKRLGVAAHLGHWHAFPYGFAFRARLLLISFNRQRHGVPPTEAQRRNPAFQIAPL